MDSAKSVYLIIALLIWLPFVFYYVKKSVQIVKESRKIPVNKIISAIVVTIVLFAVVYFHYNFTIWYQAPLVAERAGKVFNRRLAGEIDLPTYLDTMKQQGLANDEFVTVSGEELELAGFRQQPYNLSISVRTYDGENENEAIIYFMHSFDIEQLYSYIKMKKENSRWRITEHKTISTEEIEQIVPKVMFEHLTP